ncbi:hypothetical protein ES708_10680 [subsurface metagenome]
MKKLLVFLSVILICTTVIQGQVQEPGDKILRTKKGVPVLPQTGDWAIGIDATPFFQYLGNIFTTNNNPYFPAFGFTAQAPREIFGKYNISETTTYRGALLIGVSNNTSRSQNAADPDLVNKTTTSALTIGLVGGIQKNRQMFGRLVGIYGVQAGIINEPYNAGTYMGKLSFDDANDSNNNFKFTGGNTYLIMAGGFVGVEFFFAPRMALAGEFGYDILFYTQMNRKNVPENGAETITDYGVIGVEFAPTASGNLQLLFYF